MFVGSPIKNKHDDLVLLGKKLKKNNVAIDIISFGNIDENREAVKLLIDNANNSNNSHFLEVDLEHFIVDMLFISPILNDNIEEMLPADQVVGGESNTNNNNNNQGGSNNAPSGGLSQFERDINLAIQQSMEEEERRRVSSEQPKQQEINLSSKEAKNENEGNNNDETKKAVEVNTNKIPEVDEEADEDMETVLEKARVLSIKEHDEGLKREREKEKTMKDELIKNDDFMKELLGEVGLDQSDLNYVQNEVKKNDNEKDEDSTLINKEDKGKNTPGENDKGKKEKDGNESNDDEEQQKFITKNNNNNNNNK